MSDLILYVIVFDNGNEPLSMDTKMYTYTVATEKLRDIFVPSFVGYDSAMNFIQRHSGEFEGTKFKIVPLMGVNLPKVQ
jgi:hypothetical protein